MAASRPMLVPNAPHARHNRLGNRPVLLALSWLFACVACGPNAGPPNSANGQCALPGRFSGEVETGRLASKAALDVELFATGVGRWETHGAEFLGEWSRVDDVVSIRDRSTSAPGAGCAHEHLGSYRLRWTESCQALSLELVEDPCQRRSRLLQGAALRRRAATGGGKAASTHEGRT